MLLFISKSAGNHFAISYYIIQKQPECRVTIKTNQYITETVWNVLCNVSLALMK